jgi:hypothetical protein
MLIIVSSKNQAKLQWLKNPREITVDNQWLQNTREINVANLNMKKCKASRHFRNKKKE